MLTLSPPSNPVIVVLEHSTHLQASSNGILVAQTMSTTKPKPMQTTKTLLPHHMVKVAVKSASITTTVPPQLALIATTVVPELVMPRMIFVQLAGVCQQVIPPANIGLFTQPIVVMPQASGTLFLRLSLATSAMARRAIRAPAASSGLLLTSVVSICTACTSVLAV